MSLGIDPAALYFATGMLIIVALFYIIIWLFDRETRIYQQARGGMLDLTSTEARLALTDIQPVDWEKNEDDWGLAGWDERD